MKTALGAITAAALACFCGTVFHHRHWLNRFSITDGVAFLEQNGGAWLIDEIALRQQNVEIQGTYDLDRFQIWILNVSEDHSATLVCTDGDGNIALEVPIGFTDFPLKSLWLFLIRDGHDSVLMLPSEY